MKKIILPLLALAIGVTSCDSYLDINQEPNAPEEENLTNEVIITGTEMNLANGYGNYLRTIGGYYSEHYSQLFGTSNYLDFSQFITSQTRSDRMYLQLNTRTLKNLQTIQEKSAEAEDWPTYLAATTLRVFTYQALVDAFGETPYTEALNIDNLSPKFDDGDVVYTGILAELNDALSKVSDGSAPVVATFLFGDDAVANDWVQFANALKLKLLMRMSKVKDVKSEVAALVAEDNFPAEDIAWTGFWANETGKANPFFQEEFASYFGSTQKNVTLNVALLNTMQDSDDARLGAFFDKNGDGEYMGGVSGTNFSTSDFGAADFNRPSMKYNSPVYLITRSEVDFFLAEYYAQTGAANDAKTHYEAAITESFLSAGLDASDAEKVFSSGKYAYDNSKYEELIGIQKWVALSGTNNFEAWCELRRLKYPAFGTVKGTDIYNVANDDYHPERLDPATLYTPIQRSGELDDNMLLQRIRYAKNATDANANSPAVKPDKEPVFWAK